MKRGVKRGFVSCVIHGRKHGSSIGYPTANLEVTDAVRAALPKYGVYAVKVVVGKKTYAGALFWGNRTLFGETEPVCEALILDFGGDIYGLQIQVTVVQYMRGVARVSSNEELVKLIEQDIERVKFLRSKF